MQDNRKMRYILAFLILGISTVVLVILNICIGTVEIPFRDILQSIAGKSVDNERILWDIRMPRTLRRFCLAGHSDLPDTCCRRSFITRSPARSCSVSLPGRR